MKLEQNKNHFKLVAVTTEDHDRQQLQQIKIKSLEYQLK